MISLDVANEEADSFLGALSNFCERAEIAGSIRRKRPYVHDIDLVVIPRFIERESYLLFSTGELVSLLEEKLTEMEKSSYISLLANGDRMKRVLLRTADIPIDLYIATPENWSTLLLIRTGSREHNIYMCSLAKRLGMQLKADGSGLFRDGEIIAGNSEESIFQALGLNYIDPKAREIVNQ